MLLKTENHLTDENKKWEVEWIIIDPEGFTGTCPPNISLTHRHRVMGYLTRELLGVFNNAVNGEKSLITYFINIQCIILTFLHFNVTSRKGQ